MKTIEVITKKDIEIPVTSSTGHRFTSGDLYADVWFSWHHNTPEFFITYWRKSCNGAIERASTCKSDKSVISKVAKFLNVKS